MGILKVQGSSKMECDDNPPGDPEVAEEDSHQAENASWLALFNFTSKSHSIILIPAIILSILSGMVIPALAVFLGKIFDLFTSFGADIISGADLIKQVSTYGIALAGLGAASGILNAMFFGLWLLFGELQAKSAREKLFNGMLVKDLEWYDMRKSGIESLIARQQTYVVLAILYQEDR